MLRVLSHDQFGERRYDQLKKNLAHRLYVISAPATEAAQAETAFGGNAWMAAFYWSCTD